MVGNQKRYNKISCIASFRPNVIIDSECFFCIIHCNINKLIRTCHVWHLFVIWLKIFLEKSIGSFFLWYIMKVLDCYDKLCGVHLNSDFPILFQPIGWKIFGCGLLPSHSTREVYFHTFRRYGRESER